jgi:CheY-like chemotaxis protein/ATP-dependent protease Clp ATPase subunit
MNDEGQRLPLARLGDLAELLSEKVIGQPSALQYIVPYLQIYQAGLSPPDRPAGVFLLLGPTGTGKTRTVEALAEILHGSPKSLIKIDCAEYQSDHEVAKLIGSPPGYVGHRETKPRITDELLAEAVSPQCDLAIVLFDEIEKASPALTALLLGVLDRAALRLGDNTTVNFEKTMIFLTSNLGAREMLKEVRPDIGFSPAERPDRAELPARLERIALAAVRKRFSPEFVNRIDAVITYRPLDDEALSEILDHHIAELQRHVHSRLGGRSFGIEVGPRARKRLIEQGSSQEYGARELKRTIHRMLTQPLAALVAEGKVDPGDLVVVTAREDDGTLQLEVRPRSAPPPVPSDEQSQPVALVVDDNRQLLLWTERVLEEAGLTALTADDADQARDIAAHHPVDLAIIDTVLSDDGDTGLWLAFELLRRWPQMQVILVSGTNLSPDELALCKRQDFPILRKPFLAGDLVSVVQARLLRLSVLGGADEDTDDESSAPQTEE